MNVRLLTEEQMLLLEGQTYDGGTSYFKPIQDADDNWIISEKEVIDCSEHGCDWVQSLPVIVYNPKPTPTILFE